MEKDGIFREESCCFERDPLQLWLPLVREWLHLHTPGLAHGSSGRTGSAVETSGSKLGFKLWAQLGLCPLGESDVAVAQPLLCLKLCRAGLVQGAPETGVVLRGEEVVLKALKTYKVVLFGKMTLLDDS